MTTRSTEIRVGIFVFGALLVGGLTAFIVGQQRYVFDKFVEYTAEFQDVKGLRVGNVVRVAGISVGTVKDVSFAEDGRVQVRFRIAERFTSRIRGNPRSIPDESATDVPQPSRASIASKGMLGDMLIEVSIGDTRLPVWPPERSLPTRTGSVDLMVTAGRVMTEVEGTVQNLRSATEPFADQRFSRDLGTIAANLARISTDLNEGQGAIARMIHDPEMGEEFQATLANLRATSNELAQATRSVRQVADEVRAGDGSMHRLIYGNEAADAAGNIGQAAGEVAIALRTIREGDSTLHGLMYGNEGEELLANLTRASADIADITHDVRAGRGTIGGLLVDPSIYEDVKRLVGDLGRNDILRALVRYSIRRDDATEDVDVREGPLEPEAQVTPSPSETSAP